MRRLQRREPHAKKQLSWATLLKYTATITAGMNVVLFDAHKVYRWWQSADADGAEQARARAQRQRGGDARRYRV